MPLPFLEVLKITSGCRAGAMCLSAGYTGRQELNLDKFDNSLELQTARGAGESNSCDKEGHAFCSKISSHLKDHCYSERTTFIFVAVQI